MSATLTELVEPLVGPGDPCVMCGSDRKPERSRAYGEAHAETDPFCSGKCCREFHGTQLLEGHDLIRAARRATA